MSLQTWPAPSVMSEVPHHCQPSSPFLAQLSAHLGSCIPTPLALLSSTLGTLSIASWLFAQLPQIFRNYTLGSASGLSIYFLIEWTLGDTTNLLGALFTRQAAWQVLVAAYYVCVDVVLVGQYAWYVHIKPHRHGSWQRRVQGPRREGDAGEGRPDACVEPIMPSRRSSPEMTGSWISHGAKQQREAHDARGALPPLQDDEFDHTHDKPSLARAIRPVAAPPRSISPLISPRSIVYLSLLCALASAHPSPAAHLDGPTHASMSSTGTEIAGRILSWSSTLLYLGSRFPQLYKNHVRRSTSGLSPGLFIAAFFGNLFYSSSLLMNPCAWNDYPPYGGRGWAGQDGSDRLEWIGRAAPFWLGAAGVLALDGLMGLQFLMFQEDTEKEIVQDERGRWTRVTGWMRGWVPRPRSLSPRALFRGESESLLHRRTSRKSYGSLKLAHDDV